MSSILAAALWRRISRCASPPTKTLRCRICGPLSAPITLVEYGDHECPHCALARPIVNQVELFFRGRMRFVFRHFPRSKIHPHSEIAAESAEFAGAAGRFWEMHDALFENQSRLRITTIFLIAAELMFPGATQCARDRPVQKQGTQRFCQRRARRRQWHTDLFHQWCAAC